MLRNILKKASRTQGGGKNVKYHSVFMDHLGFWVAMCGTEPSRMSSWSKDAGSDVNCPKCLNALTRVRDRVTTDKLEYIN